MFDDDDIFAPLDEAIRESVEFGMQEIVRRVKEHLNTPYPPSSKPGEPPRKRTGALRDSVGYTIEQVGDTEFQGDLTFGVPYAVYLAASGRDVVGSAPDEVARRVDAEIERIS